jgi:hypothetical protein
MGDDVAGNVHHRPSGCGRVCVQPGRGLRDAQPELHGEHAGGLMHLGELTEILTVGVS